MVDKVQTSAGAIRTMPFRTPTAACARLKPLFGALRRKPCREGRARPCRRGKNSVLRHHGPAEAVVEPGPDDAVGQVRAGGENRHAGQRVGVVEGSVIDEQILELRGPEAAERVFDAAPGDPADAVVVDAAGRKNRIGWVAGVTVVVMLSVTS